MSEKTLGQIAYEAGPASIPWDEQWDFNRLAWECGARAAVLESQRQHYVEIDTLREALEDICLTLRLNGYGDNNSLSLIARAALQKTVDKADKVG